MLAAGDGAMRMEAAAKDQPFSLALGELLGEAVRLGPPVAGGSIHRAQALTLASGERLFLKSSPPDRLPLLQAEMEGLAALAAAADPGLPLRIPPVRACGLAGDQAVLVLEWLALQASASRARGDQVWHDLGAALAGLHRRSIAMAGPGEAVFGWARDNWIGSAPQLNRGCKGWATFFRDYRLAPQLAWAQRRGQPFTGAEKVLAQVERWLGDHQPEPALVHGDLWAGNLGVLADGGGCLFDPAVHRADREVDLAMAALFGGVPPAFFAGYEATWPRPQGHQRRQRLYNLYHELNHANLFGGGYRDQAQATIRHLLASW